MLKKIRKVLLLLLTLILILSVQGKVNAANYETYKISDTKRVVIKKGKTIKLTASNKNITWKSSNSKIAKVNKKGKVTALRTGKVKITAKNNKKKYSCTVVVKKKLSVPEKENISLKLTDFKNDIVTFEISNDSDMKINFDNCFSIERQNNGKWIPVGVKQPVKDSYIHSVKSGTKKYEFSRNVSHYQLEDGIYRCIFRISYKESNGKTKTKNFIATNTLKVK